MPYTLTPMEEAYDLDIETLDELQGRAECEDRWILNFGPQHPLHIQHFGLFSNLTENASSTQLRTLGICIVVLKNLENTKTLISLFALQAEWTT